MAMLTAAGGAAIENALQEELADYASKRANMTLGLTQDEANAENAVLVAKLKARIMTDIDAAWSD